MSFPIFPLQGGFDISQDFSVTTAETSFAEGGLRDCVLLELNNSARVFPSFTRTVVGTSNKSAIQSFLISKQGIQPFYIDFFGNTSYDLVVCKRWNWTWISVETWIFNATFEEVFRPENT